MNSKRGQAVLISLHTTGSDAALMSCSLSGALAQLGERLICIQEVRSSILLGSTKICGFGKIRTYRT